MKLVIFFALILVIFVAYAQAQDDRDCPGRPENPLCRGSKDKGYGGRGCRKGHRWYYKSSDRKCKKMDYKGCGGNDNRWCSKDDCERNCRRD